MQPPERRLIATISALVLLSALGIGGSLAAALGFNLDVLRVVGGIALTAGALTLAAYDELNTRVQTSLRHLTQRERGWRVLRY